MKSLLEYKKEALIIPPSKQWEEIFSQILERFETWGVKDRAEEFSQLYFKFYKFNDKTRFEADFITALIHYTLDLKPETIWHDIFQITREEGEELSYHSSLKGIKIIRWKFNIKDKNTKLNEITGEWVFNNHRRIKEFLDVNNKKYNQLQLISKLFPLEETED